MARILVAADGHWYDELRAVAYYFERDVEKWILQHAKALFPHHYVFPFKRDIVSERLGGAKRPDLALVRRDFAEWAIVEVEVGEHELPHVLEQVQVFANGEYNSPEIAEYAQRQLQRHCGKTVTLERLTRLFSNQLPAVLVVADTPDTAWQEDLEREGADLCAFQIYKSVRGLYMYRTSGEYPAVRTEEAHCRPLLLRPNVLEIIGDFEFKRLGKKKIVQISYEGYLTRWELIVDGGRQYLQFAGASNPLSPTGTYSLFRDRSHHYFLSRS